MAALTSHQIMDRLELAAYVLQRLPNPTGSGARGYGGSWPDVVHEAHLSYGWAEARMRVIPSAKDIQDMETALGWLELVRDPLDRRIVWMRAEGHRWRAVCRRVGLVRQTCHRRALAALLTIEKHLAAEAKRSGQSRKGGARGTGGDMGSGR